MKGEFFALGSAGMGMYLEAGHRNYDPYRYGKMVKSKWSRVSYPLAQ
jgi:hypothetical protein